MIQAMDSAPSQKRPEKGLEESSTALCELNVFSTFSCHLIPSLKRGERSEPLAGPLCEGDFLPCNVQYQIPFFVSLSCPFFFYRREGEERRG